MHVVVVVVVVCCCSLVNRHVVLATAHKAVSV